MESIPPFARRFFVVERSLPARPAGRCRASRPARNGAVLLEVVLALTLFVAAATIITGGLNTAVRETEKLRLNVHASNLAVTVLSELQMGLRTVATTGPEPFDPPFEMWTCQIQVSAPDEFAVAVSDMQKVEIIVRYGDQPVVRRLTQLVPLSVAASSTEEATPVGPNRSTTDALANPPETGNP